MTHFVHDANENTVRVDSPLAVSGNEPDNAVVVAFDVRDLAVAVTRGAGSAGASTWSRAPCRTCPLRSHRPPAPEPAPAAPPGSRATHRAGACYGSTRIL